MYILVCVPEGKFAMCQIQRNIVNIGNLIDGVEADSAFTNSGKSFQHTDRPRHRACYVGRHDDETERDRIDRYSFQYSMDLIGCIFAL